MSSNTLKLTALAVAALASLHASAQTKPDGVWRGSAGAALSATSGNTKSTAVQLNADAERATTADKTTLGAAINYGKSGDATTANKWGGFGQYDFNLSPQIYAFGRLGLEGDKLIDLSRRMALSGGLGYKIIDTDALKFDVFGGLGYTTDKYSSLQVIGGKSDDSFSRSSIYLGESSSHVLSPTVSFKQRLDLFTGVSGDKAVLAKFTAGLAVAMSSQLSLNVGLTDNYNSKPAAGAKKNDAGIFTGISSKF